MKQWENQSTGSLPTVFPSFLVSCVILDCSTESKNSVWGMVFSVIQWSEKPERERVWGGVWGKLCLGVKSSVVLFVVRIDGCISIQDTELKLETFALSFFNETFQRNINIQSSHYWVYRKAWWVVLDLKHLVTLEATCEHFFKSTLTQLSRHPVEAL